MSENKPSEIAIENIKRIGRSFGYDLSSEQVIKILPLFNKMTETGNDFGTSFSYAVSILDDVDHRVAQAYVYDEWLKLSGQN